MTLDEYQLKALSTARETGNYFNDLCHFVLGTVGESGEIAEKLKKIIRDKNGELTIEDKNSFSKEIGDVLWYIAVLSDHLGLTLDEVASENVAKLASRKQRGVIGGSGDDR